METFNIFNIYVIRCGVKSKWKLCLLLKKEHFVSAIARGKTIARQTKPRFNRSPNGNTDHSQFFKCHFYFTKKLQWNYCVQGGKSHMLIFTAEALLGKLLKYISNFLLYCPSIYSTSSSEKILLMFPTLRNLAFYF